jgi:hypothetical protein
LIAFRSERSRVYCDHYATLVEPGRLPLRSQLKPDAVAGILSTFVILEVEGPGVVRFRLAGTREVDRYGFEVTGRNYIDFVPPRRQAAAFGAFRAMTDRPCGMYALIRSQTRIGRIVLNEALGYPLRSDRSGRVHLVFQSNDVEVDPHRHLDVDPLAVHDTVLERRFIDVGFGTPDVAIDGSPAGPLRADPVSRP